MCKHSFTVINKRYGINGQPYLLPIPCGKCPQCVSKRVAEWKWRMEQELLVSTTPYFVTLTYNRESVPYGVNYSCYPSFDERNTATLFRVLEPKHLTDYIKRLRKHHTESQIRYFAVGEYGSKKGRPHYHIILLNCDDIRLICDQWKFGRVDISPVRSIDSVGYCLGYLKKKAAFVPPNFPQFSRMSKGLGRSYINSQTIEYHNRVIDNSTVDLTNGRTIPLPKYMKDRIYDDFSRYKLGKYLQNIADTELDRKVKEVMLHTGKSEADVRKSFFVEPFVEKKPKIFPTVF